MCAKIFWQQSVELIWAFFSILFAWAHSDCTQAALILVLGPPITWLLPVYTPVLLWQHHTTDSLRFCITLKCASTCSIFCLFCTGFRCIRCHIASMGASFIFPRMTFLAVCCTLSSFSRFDCNRVERTRLFLWSMTTPLKETVDINCVSSLLLKVHHRASALLGLNLDPVSWHHYDTFFPTCSRTVVTAMWSGQNLQV